MRRRTFVAGSLTLLAVPVAADAQDAGKAYRVAYLQTAPRAATEHLLAALEEGLRDHGYIPGKNLVLEYRFADGRAENLPALAAELVQFRPDVIVTGLNPVTVAVRQTTGSIPIVTALGADLVEAGLIQSLARPGGNVTGLTLDAGAEIVGRRLQLLRELVPNGSRLAVLFNPVFRSRVSATSPLQLVQEAATKLGFMARPFPVRGPDDFAEAFTALIRERTEALYVPSDPLVFANRVRLTELAMRHRIPAMYVTREYVDAGGLMAYATDLRDLYRRAATHVDKLLKGARAADLPVEQPTRFELVINLKTAKALGLTMPRALLLRADQLIE